MKIPVAILIVVSTALLAAGRIMYQVGDLATDVTEIKLELRQTREKVLVLESHARSWYEELGVRK